MLNYLAIGTVIANYHGSRTSLGYLASVDATHAVVVWIEDERLQTMTLASLKFFVVTGTVAPEADVQKAVAIATAKKFTRDAAKEAAEKAFAAECEALRSNPALAHLEPAQGRASSRLASKNLRKHLQHKFPGVKFSVRQSGSRTHSSLYVEWTGGPAAREVNAIANAFTAGSFNGMTDSYEYSRSAFGEVFGDVQYISTRRNTVPGEGPPCECPHSDWHREWCPQHPDNLPPVPAEVLAMRQVWGISA